MTILALQLASPIIRAVDIGGADNPGSTAEVSRSDEARRDGLLARESLLAQALELGLDVLRAAVRADAVGELRLGVPLDVALDLLPVVLVVADLLAVGADRQEPVEQLHAGERGLELFHPVGEGRLELEQSLADADPRVQLIPLEGLDDVVVGARREARHDVLGARPRRHENQVGFDRLRQPAQSSAGSDAGSRWVITSSLARDSSATKPI